MQYSVTVEDLTKKRVLRYVRVTLYEAKTSKLLESNGGLLLHCMCTKIDHHPLPVPLLTLTLASKFISFKILIRRAVDLISAAAMCQCKDHVDNHH